MHKLIRRLPEVKQYCRKKPIILVGTKKEFRDCDWTKSVLEKVNQVFGKLSEYCGSFYHTFFKTPVKTDQGRKVADDAKLNGYFECSSKEKDGVKEIFNEAARLAVNYKKRKGKPCKMQ